jgi:hypothetical protein
MDGFGQYSMQFGVDIYVLSLRSQFGSKINGIQI